MTVVRSGNDFEPLARNRLFQTTELDSARDIVSRNFCRHRLDRATTRDNFDACYNRVVGNRLSLNYLRYGADVEIEPGELGGFYLIQVPVRGNARITTGGQCVEANGDTASILNPTHHTSMRWFEGCEKILVQIDRDRLQSTVESLIGHALTGSPAFAPNVDLRRPEMKRWAMKLRTCVEAIDAGYEFAGERHFGSVVEEELLHDFIESQPSNFDGFLRDDRPAFLPRQVRVARDFMHSNLAEDISIGDVARAAGASVRCLQLAFRHHYGCSPLQYLRRQRLNMAHFELQQPESPGAVADVAYSLGFHHLGRFSAAYRQAFGITPSTTLHRSH
ncbi:AraC family transcriptional regulator [Hoeflea sp. CAU 1731]